MNLNYPRLAAPVAIGALREWHGLEPDAVAEKAATWRAPLTWYEVGPRVERDDERLDRLARDLREIAASHGYPGRRRDQVRYERETGLRLLDEPIADVGAEGVWACLSVALLPDVVVWRWGWPRLKGDETTASLTARKLERFLGGFRNNFRRARQRVSQFGSAQDDAPAVFWEDALVSVEERPSLGDDPRIARLLFHAAKPLLDYGTYSERQDVFRSVAREVRQVAGIRLLPTMRDEAVYEVVVEALADHAPDAAPPPLSALSRAHGDPRLWARERTPNAEPSMVEIELTGGAVRNGYLSVRSARDWFTGGRVRMRFVGTGEMVETEVDPTKLVLRARAEVARFYEFYELEEGDSVQLTRQGPRWIQVEPL
jgi:hypothetical protein